MLHDGQHAIFPAVDRPVAVAVLVHQTNVLKDVPLLIVGLENRFMLVHLAETGSHRIGVEVAAAALQLMAPERGLHDAVALVPGFAREKLVRMLIGAVGPPGEAITALPCGRFGKGLHLQVHVHMQHLIVTEGVLPVGPPDAEVARKPTAQIAVHLDRWGS